MTDPNPDTFKLPMAWQELTAVVNGSTLFGQGGVRDPEAPCDAFAPVAGIDWLGLRVTSHGRGPCQSDGHYLCFGCAEFSAEKYEENHG